MLISIRMEAVKDWDVGTLHAKYTLEIIDFKKLIRLIDLDFCCLVVVVGLFFSFFLLPPLSL